MYHFFFCPECFQSVNIMIKRRSKLKTVSVGKGKWTYVATVILQFLDCSKIYLGLLFCLFIDIQLMNNIIYVKCTQYSYSEFKGLTPVLVIIKHWLYSLCCRVYPCSIFLYIYKSLYLLISYLYVAASLSVSHLVTTGFFPYLWVCFVVIVIFTSLLCFFRSTYN